MTSAGDPGPTLRRDERIERELAEQPGRDTEVDAGAGPTP